MNTLLDPNFAFPNLIKIAEGMVAGTISAEEASILARKVTGGEIRQISMGRARVIGPQSGTMQVLQQLQAYANAHDQRTPHRWAAFLLMVETQLGVGDIDPAGASLGFANALKAFEACVKATGARCPPTAVTFALKAVDSLLENPACTDPEVRASLTAARASFQASG